MTKFQDTRDRYSSVPNARTSYDPDWRKNAPPAPPPRSLNHGSNDIPQTSTSTPSKPSPSRPPPARYTTRPTSSASPDYGAAGLEKSTINWAKLSQEDKQVFFSWLDEFFARYVSISPSNDDSDNVADSVPPPIANRPSIPEPPTSSSLPVRGPPVSLYILPGLL